MRKLTGWLFATILVLAGCTFEFEVMRPVTPQATPFATQSTPSAVATISPTAELPSATPTTFTGPVFHHAFFTSDPAMGLPETFFPAGTKQVFAVWSYQNMRAGLHLKREWYLSGQLWFTHEEEWNFDQYGENGVVRNVSLYDFDAGLPAGVYQLRMYIDDVIQPIATSASGQPETVITFEIGAVAQNPVSTTPVIPGDLGWGRIHGMITNARTGAPIAGASVTCEHHSYASPTTCSGSATTNADGLYVFEDVFFHDTDSIILTIQATGYQLQEISQTSFTRNDMEVNASLIP